MEVIQLTARDEDAYTAFVRSRPDGLLYHALPYRDLLVDQLGCTPEYLLAVDGGEVRGVLPLMWAGEAGARVDNSLPFYGSHGRCWREGPEAASRAARRIGRARRRPAHDAATIVANPSGRARRRSPFTTSGRADQPGHDLPGDEGRSSGRARVRGAMSARRRARDRSGRRDVGGDGRGSRRSIATWQEIGGLAKERNVFASIPRHFQPGRDYEVHVARLDGAAWPAC